VRQRRIDPRTDVASVRLAALDVIAEHEARSLTGAVATLDEPDAIVGQIVADVSGFGPLQPLLDDENVEDFGPNHDRRNSRLPR
jgi:pilus assembly protein CpaF